MTCDHTAGVDVRSELVFRLDDLSGGEAHKYILDVLSVTCRGCGCQFTLGGNPGVALRLDAPPAIARRAVTIAPIVEAADFELAS